MSDQKKQTFNVNAPAYRPNVNATPYVPSFTVPAQPAQPAQPVNPAQPLPAKSVSLPAKSVSLPAKSVSLPAKSVPLPSSSPVTKKEEPKEEEPKKEQPKKEQPKKEEPKKEEPKKEEPQKEEPKKEEKEKEKENEDSPSVSTSASYDLESELALLTAREEGKEHMSIVFMGHVDAGKSTTAGHILVVTGMVDKRTLEKYEREAKDKGRESWYLSWALDTNPEERDKGKTVEVGRASFETETKRYTILDAPGHKSYVPNMISGAAQADVGVLILSARKGEFESGFDKQGQTREHAMLAKTAGIRKLIVAINKMDDPTVGWSKERYDEILDKILPFLKQLGFNPKTDLEFLPISGFSGANLKDPLTPDVCPWFSGPSLIQLLDKMEKIQRKEDAPFRIPITEKFRDMGIVVSGKVEAGLIALNQKVLVMPNKTQAEIQSIEIDENPVKIAKAGENVRLKLKGVEEEDVSIGFVLCHPSAPVHVASSFDAQIVILEYKNIICSGFSAVMHIHTLVEEITIAELKYLVDRKTGRRTKLPPKFVKQGQAFIARIETKGPICIETHNDYPQLGRFTIRHDGKTIAMGKVLKLNTAAAAAAAASVPSQSSSPAPQVSQN